MRPNSWDIESRASDCAVLLPAGRKLSSWGTVPVTPIPTTTTTNLAGVTQVNALDNKQFAVLGESSLHCGWVERSPRGLTSEDC